jgi:phytoene synthase
MVTRVDASEKYLLAEFGFELKPFSPEYVSLMFLSSDVQKQVRLFFWLDRAFESIFRGASDPSLVLGKVAFWREELALFAEGNEKLRHPLTRYMQGFPSLRSIDFSPFLNREEFLLGQNRFLDMKQLDQYLDLQVACWGVFTSVFALARGQQITFSPESLFRTYEKMKMVVDVHSHVKTGHVFFPINTLQQHQVKAAYLLNRQAHASVVSLLGDWKRDIDSEKKQLALLFSSNQYEEIKPFMILFRLLSQKFERMVQLGEKWLDPVHVEYQKSIRLVPILSFWEAWKTWVFVYDRLDVN